MPASSVGQCGDTMNAMQTYVILMNFTTKGAETLLESSRRYEQFEEGIRELGGKVVSAYGLLGDYDVLIVAEFPDEKAAMKTVVRAASRGTATSKTLTAIPIKEFYALVQDTLAPRA
jgi:uncharacterized protein with GYD domain